MSISCNWSGFESHWTLLNGVCDTHWFGTAIEKSKARNNVVPTNLSTAFDDDTKRYDVLYDTTVIVITTPSPYYL